MLLFLANIARADPDPGPAPPAPPPAPAGAAHEGRDEPSAVVAIGNGLIAGHPSSAEVSSSSSVPGGWVPVLADCLEERAPQRFSVVDRAVPAETVISARQRVAAVRDLSPGFVVVALGAQDLAAEPPAGDLKRLKGELDDLVVELLGRGRRIVRPTVLLLSMVPPALVDAPEDPEHPGTNKLDERIDAWNDALAQIARGKDGVVHVNLLADWPREPEARAALTHKGWTLSDQGYARVAAAVCDAILASGASP